MIQSFRRIKIDPNDKLYSEIIRTLANGICQRCHKYFGFSRLQCAHIIGRGHHGTRFALKPKRNAVALCAGCHSWFDTHKIQALIFDEEKRVLSSTDESFTWLVKTLFYTWGELYKLYALGHHQTNKYGVLERQEINKQLKAYLAGIKNEEK